MKKVVITLALIVGILTLWTFAAYSCHHTVKPAKVKTVSAVCPVMGMKIPDIKKAAGKSLYKGKTYYFCCTGCKPVFDKNPGKYVKQ